MLHFIQENYGTTSQVTIEGNGPTIEHPRGLTYVSRVLEKDPSADITDEYVKEERLIEKRELVRISTCAIFHKYTRGPGVPHTFVGFIRQWPALPQVVVCNCHFTYHCLLIGCDRSSYLFVFCPLLQYRPKSNTLSGKSSRLEVRDFLSLHGYYKTIELGIYGVTYYLGFRDEFNVDVNLKHCSIMKMAYPHLVRIFGE